MLSIKNIYKKFDRESILNGFSLNINSGESVAILGPSGSGKSTLLKCINRLLELDSGEIFFQGKNILDYKLKFLRSKISYLFQKGLIFPHMNVRKNIELPIRSNINSYSRYLELMDLVELDPNIFSDRYTSELSGGQSQRVALAQALAVDPDLILLDEPFNGLDKEIKFNLINKLLEIKRKSNKTYILVTHDNDEANALADRVVELN